jgi:glucan phosphoethanolaminetransferase (alkaline phosphatase superfamily)
MTNDQRTRKPFLHGLRGKTNRKLISVVFICFAIMVLLVNVGRLDWSLEIAKHVPSAWKYFLGIAMFFLVWYVDWKVSRRVLDHALPRLGLFPVIVLGFIMFAFAIVSADRRSLFFTITFISIAYGYVSYRFLLYRLKRQEEKRI